MYNKTEQGQASSKTKLNALCCSADSDGVKAHLAQSPMDVNYEQGNPLILAIRSVQVYPPPSKEKCVATLKALVDAGADVHINEESPLYWAMKVDNHAAVEFLLSVDNKFSIDGTNVEDYVERNPHLDSKLVDLLEGAKAPTAPSMGY